MQQWYKISLFFLMKLIVSITLTRNHILLSEYKTLGKGKLDIITHYHSFWIMCHISNYGKDMRQEC